MKKLLISIAMLMMVLQLLLVACSSQKEYVVTIDGNKVSVEEFKMYLYEVQKNFETLGGTDIWEVDFEGKTAEEVAKEATLNSIAYIKISSKKAREMKISLTKEEEIQAKTDAVTTIEAIDEQTFLKIGIDEKELTKIMEEKTLRNKVFVEVTKSFELSEKDFERYFLAFIEEQKETLVSLDLQYIFFETYTTDGKSIENFSEEQKKKVLEKANDVLALAKAGEDFDVLVKSYSNGKSENAGKETVSKGMYIAEFEDVAFGLDVGEISGLVATDSGYYIIKLNNVIEPNLEDIKNESKDNYILQRKQEIFEQEYKKWQNDKKIEKNPEVWDEIKIEISNN